MFVVLLYALGMHEQWIGLFIVSRMQLLYPYTTLIFFGIELTHSTPVELPAEPTLHPPHSPCAIFSNFTQKHAL